MLISVSRARNEQSPLAQRSIVVVVVGVGVGVGVLLLLLLLLQYVYMYIYNTYVIICTYDMREDRGTVFGIRVRTGATS